MSTITTQEVERIAKLARIGLTAAETDKMAAEIGVIVGFARQLNAVDVAGVAPTDQVTGLTGVTRPDVVRPSMPREELLANAPMQKDGYILVKRVLNG